MSDTDPVLLAALSDPETYPGRPRVEVRETHASRVFLAGDRAYKVKKPLSLGFLDYGTLARRRGACEEEVRVNRELAPEVYVGVRAIVPANGGLRLAGENAPDAVEYAVEMRRFDERDTLAGVIAAGELGREELAQVSHAIARFHNAARVIDDWSVERVLATWRRNLDELATREPPAPWHMNLRRGFAGAFVAAHGDALETRARDGLVRDGHGDLRCEHVLVRPRVRVVDRVEFDARLRELDVAGDLAFLTMDLEALGRRGAAADLVTAYGQTGMDPGGEVLRSFYGAHWALVRAKVTLIADAEREGGAHPSSRDAAEHLAALSDRLTWRARGPLAFVICGPAASGKSVLARELARVAELEVISSDIVRKRLARVEPHQRARAEHYSAEFTRATYEQVARDALCSLRRGIGLVVDATCRTRADRAPLLEGLAAAGARPLFVRCTVPLALALARARSRMGERAGVSDATPAIVIEQFGSFEDLVEVPSVQRLELDASGSCEEQVTEIAQAIDTRAMLANATVRASAIGGGGVSV